MRRPVRSLSLALVGMLLSMVPASAHPDGSPFVSSDTKERESAPFGSDASAKAEADRTHGELTLDAHASSTAGIGSSASATGSLALDVSHVPSGRFIIELDLVATGVVRASTGLAGLTMGSEESGATLEIFARAGLEEPLARNLGFAGHSLIPMSNDETVVAQRWSDSFAFDGPGCETRRGAVIGASARAGTGGVLSSARAFMRVTIEGVRIVPLPCQRRIDVMDNSFRPASITIEAPETVRFVWRPPWGTFNDHRILFDDLPQSYPVDYSTYEGNWEPYLPDPGRYPYYCSVHGGPGGIGMSGVIVVV